MLMSTSNSLSVARKPRFSRAAVVASLALASATIGSSSAIAAIICSNFPAPVDVPATIDGAYVNFATGVVNLAGTVAGWDFNAYQTGGNLRFFTSTNAANTNRIVGTGTTADVLPAGTMIDGSSPLTTAGIVNPGALLGGVTNGYVGVAFNNEGTATTNYAWVSLSTTGPTGYPVTINQYCYQDDGSGIMAGTTPVSLQSYSVD